MKLKNLFDILWANRDILSSELNKIENQKIGSMRWKSLNEYHISFHTMKGQYFDTELGNFININGIYSTTFDIESDIFTNILEMNTK